METERKRLTVEGYLDEVLGLFAPVSSEELSLAEAAGRTLAVPVTSRGPVPAFANSAMDGFAVRHVDLHPDVVLREVASVAAGSADDPPVGPGECARIMTGAPVPSDTDTIVQREFVTESAAGIVVHEYPGLGIHVRRAGEDLAADDVILHPGHLLDARALSLVAACGRDTVEVRRRPRFAVASTGDELTPPGQDLGRGQIYESNSVFLVEAARRDGADVVRRDVLPDDLDAFAGALDALADGVDLVILSGGVSVGDFDVVRIGLAERGEAAFRAVFMQPGKPQGWARWRTAAGAVVPVIALPGNPLSAAVSYEMFVRPCLSKMLGRPPLPDEAAVVTAGWRSPAGRRQIIPVVAETDADGVRRIRPAHPRDSASHLVSALALANALAFVPEEVTAVEPGDVLTIRSLT